MPIDFRQWVVHAIKGEARKIARETISKEISSEIDRLVKKWVEDKSSTWHEGHLDKQVRLAMEKAVSKELNSPSNEDIIATTFEEAKKSLRTELFDYMMYKKDFDKEVKKHVEKLVKEQVPLSMYEILKGK